MLCQLVIEIEQDECGFHGVIIDVSDDAVLWLTNSYHRIEDAEKAAAEWIERNQ